MNEYEYTIELKNTTTTALKVIVEPWGNEYELGFSQTARIGFVGPKIKTIPIDHQADCIIIEGVEELRSLGVWIDGELVG